MRSQSFHACGARAYCETLKAVLGWMKYSYCTALPQPSSKDFAFKKISLLGDKGN